MLDLLATMLVLGLVHGLAPDHCLAVSALAAGHRYRAVVGIAVRFGASHTAVLFLFAAGLLFFHWDLSAHLGRAGDIATGVLLIILGLVLIFERLGRRLGLSQHAHQQPGDARAKNRSGWMVGAVFALAGLRNALMALPIAMHHGIGLALTALLLFGGGITLSMIGYGLFYAAAQNVARGRGVAENALRIVVGVASCVLGVIWIAGA
jgi:hypothetical protein